MALQYPAEWKFDDEDAAEVSDPLRKEVRGLIEKIARSADDEQAVVEGFKSRFGNADTSSSVSWAYGDLSVAMAEMTNGAEFAEAFWLGVEDAGGKGYVVPTLAQVNRLFAKHRFPFVIDPPHLRRTDAGGSTPAPAATVEEPAQGSVPASPQSGGPSRRAPSTPSSRPLPFVPPPAPTTMAARAVADPKPTPSKVICFVAQPFCEPYQTRFVEDIEPAINAAGLDAYKVDGDEAADWLVHDIHAGIRRAAVVLVDITLDKPNVWYELGFSQAMEKPLVMICNGTATGDRPFPFDVGGRKIIMYKTDTRGGLDQLQKDITARIKALLARGQDLARTAPSKVPDSALAPASAAFREMDPPTRAAFLAVLECSTLPGESVSLFLIGDLLHRVGRARADANLGILRLLRLGLIERHDDKDDWGNAIPGVRLTDAGDEFLDDNHAEIVTATSQLHSAAAPPAATAAGDDDIPF